MIAAVRRTTASVPSRQGEIVRYLDVVLRADICIYRSSVATSTVACGDCLGTVSDVSLVSSSFAVCCRPSRHDKSDGIRCGISSC